MAKDLEREERLRNYQNDIFWSIIFQEIDRLVEKLADTEKEEAFIKLFYDGNRANKIILLKEKLVAYKNIGANYLIKGVAGVGKTTFIERIIAEKEFFKNEGVYIAYVKSNKKIKDSYLINFIDELTKYFDEINVPLQSPIDKTSPNGISNAIVEIASHLKKIENPRYMPIVFIDDLDYVEDEWKEIISEINHFIFSSKIGICITMRPRLFAQLSNEDDRTTRNFDESKTITLMPIPIKELVCSKIFLILKEYETYKSSQIKETLRKMISYVTHWDRADNTLIKVLKSYGVENIQEFQKIDYPFNTAFEEFMQKATGNNLRRMFLIIKKSMPFILSGGVLEDETTGHWVLNKGSIKELFFNLENSDTEYNALNIHFERSEKTGKSICYYILKMMSSNALRSSCDITDEKFVTSISDAVGGGVTNKKIVELIQRLSERHFALIDLIKNTGFNEKYEISEKGRYYLNELSQWNEYKEVFGTENEPLINS